MALKATVCKAALQVSDMERGYYGDHALTVARHPSETDERMMMRVLAWALNADDALSFGAGLSNDDEPALWLKDLTGAIKTWIDVGLPEEKRIRRACGRAERVCIYTYGGHSAELWWNKLAPGLQRLTNLTVYGIPQAQSQRLAALADRSMQLTCTVQDGDIWISSESLSVQLALEPLKPPSRA